MAGSERGVFKHRESHEADEAAEDIAEILLSAGYCEDEAAAEAKCRAVLAAVGLRAGGSVSASGDDDNSSAGTAVAAAAAAPPLAAEPRGEEQTAPNPGPERSDPGPDRTTADPCCAGAAVAALLLVLSTVYSAQQLPRPGMETGQVPVWRLVKSSTVGLHMR